MDYVVKTDNVGMFQILEQGDYIRKELTLTKGQTSSNREPTFSDGCTRCSFLIFQSYLLQSYILAGDGTSAFVDSSIRSLLARSC